MSARSLAGGLVLLAFVSLHVQALCTVVVAGHIEVVPVHAVVTALSLAWLIAVIHSGRTPTRLANPGVMVALMAVGWTTLQASRSPEPLRGLTMVSLAVLGLALMLVVASGPWYGADLRRLNAVVFGLGLVVAVVAVLAFIPALMDSGAIAADRARWKPGVIYELDRGGIVRLSGFATDPNFYGLFMTLPLLCGLFSAGVRTHTRLAGLGVLSLSVLLTFSRTVLVAAGVALGVHIVLQSVARRKWKLPGGGLSLLILLMTGVALMLVPLPPLGGRSLAAWLASRIDIAGETPRFLMWRQLLAQVLENPLLGRGLRSSEVLLAGQYSHNTYLDLVFEQGLVGLLLYLVFVVFVFFRAFRASCYDVEARPWLLSWVVCAVALASFSLAYSPYVWLLAGVIVGLRRGPLVLEGAVAVKRDSADSSA